jgi:anti-sigma-K factor RskA
MSEIHDFLLAYALDELGLEERRAFEAHLQTCDACTDELAALGEGLETMFWSADETAPATLRASVMANVADLAGDTAEDGSVAPVVDLRSRRRFGPILGAVAAALVLVVAVGVGLRPSEEDRIVSASDAIELAVGVTPDNADEDAQVTLTYSEVEGGAVLTATGLDEVDPDQTYEMWIIDENGPAPAGLFRPDESGAIRVLVDGVPSDGTVFGITVEPASGSPQPTGAVLFATEI